MSCQLIAFCTGSPVVRSHTTVVSRWFVMPTATTSATVSCAVASASATTCCTLRQISSGSCSTQPGRGKMCWCSTWLTETTRARSSKIRQRDEAVPWSTEAMKRSLTRLFLARRLSPRDRAEVAARGPVRHEPLDRAGDRDRADRDAAAVVDRRRDRDLPHDELLRVGCPAAREHAVELGRELARRRDRPRREARQARG